MADQNKELITEVLNEIQDLQSMCSHVIAHLEELREKIIKNDKDN